MDRTEIDLRLHYDEVSQKSTSASTRSSDLPINTDSSGSHCRLYLSPIIMRQSVFTLSYKKAWHEINNTFRPYIIVIESDDV